MAHPKGVLIERLQKEGRQPQFKTEATGPDHEPTFLSDALVEGEVLGTGQGGTKRDAERRAAEEALRYLDQQERDAAQPTGGKRGQGKRGQKQRPHARQGEAAPEDAEHAAPVPPEDSYEEPFDGPFEGPWPIFEDVLAASLQIANDRLDRNLTGEASIASVRELALELYKSTLEDLGELVEVDEES